MTDSYALLTPPLTLPYVEIVEIRSMKKKHYLYPLLFVLLLTLAAFGMQLMSKTRFDKSVGLQEIQDATSFTKEAVVIISLYKEHKIPFTYVETQLDQISRKILSFYQDLDASTVPEDQRTMLQGLNTVVFATALDLKTAGETKGDVAKLIKIQNDLTKQNSAFKELEKTYE